MQNKFMPAVVMLIATAALADSARQSDDGVITLTFDKPAAKVATQYTASRWGVYDVEAVYEGDGKPAAGEALSVQAGDRKSQVEGDKTRLCIAKDGKNAVIAESPSGKLLIKSLVLTPATEGKTVVQAEDHSITLHCRDAIVHGTTLRYESAALKSCLGYWVREKDWASWDFDVKYPGKFNVFVMQGSNGGSEAEIQVGPQPPLKFTAKNTGSFHTHTFLEVGTVTIDKPGPMSLALKPTRKVGAAIMDLRAVYLLPVMR